MQKMGIEMQVRVCKPHILFAWKDGKMDMQLIEQEYVKNERKRMKRIARITIIMVLVLMMSPLVVFADPEGFCEIEITKDNFFEYFGYRKAKKTKTSGKYDGYEYQLYCKLREKGYYLFQTHEWLNVEGTYKYRAKQNVKGKVKKYKGKKKFFDYMNGPYVTDGIERRDKTYNYNYSRISNIKINKAKGRYIFVKPSNVDRVEPEYHNGVLISYLIILKHPYPDTYPKIVTLSRDVYDAEGNALKDANGKRIKEYYLRYSPRDYEEMRK